jgi:O-antigen/teichoic acid export membrane protein
MGVVRFLVVSCVYLIIYPILLKSLGAFRFGVWAILCVPSQYAAIGDLGFSTALAKRIAEAPPNQGPERIRELTSAGTTLFVFVASIMALFVIIWQRSIPQWIHVERNVVPEADGLLLGMVAVIAITLMGNAYTSVLSGLQRMAWMHAIQLGGAVVNALCILTALRLSGTLTSLMLCNVVSATFVWLTAMLVAKRAANVSLSLFPRLRWCVIRSLLKFSAYIGIAGMAALLMEPALKILLARLDRIESVSYFELAARIVTQSRSLFQFAMLPLLPASSFLADDLPRIRSLYARSFRVLFALAIPLYLGFAILSRPIVAVWLGRGSGPVAVGVAVLSVGWLFNVLTLPDFLMIQGMNRPRQAMICAVLQGVLCVLCAWVLIPAVGYLGAFASEALGLIVASAYIHGRFVRLSATPMTEALSNSPRRLGVLLAAFAACLWCILALTNWLAPAVWILLYVVATLLFWALLYRRPITGFNMVDLFRSVLPDRRLPPERLAQPTLYKSVGKPESSEVRGFEAS